MFIKISTMLTIPVDNFTYVNKYSFNIEYLIE